MKNYCVYMILCVDNTIYTGITNNLTRRYYEHSCGLNPLAYTYSRRPIRLIFQQDFLNFEGAVFFEKKLKKWSHKKKMALASGEEELLKILSECKNASHFKNKE
ncbi:GIY-YIG nuclease family protein [Zeaxanthinibacter sp. PT1]|uniref:GIY-YIG nuclease family protein n=1 Tax=Zeaxanthinibacter TaxID=561554 RepID=UPI00234AE977|nr:GIY-YIG nuclease family protein [Zeaxanthinibacter sp. PT1]MDC6350504.1 GIY-YIG nuclease family protein [Zeaxanthinibacter sp. PT1]